jgi:hypothetical protein
MTSQDPWRQISIEGSDLRVTVLPERGAEISSIVHVPTGTETLYQAVWGRPGPEDPPLDGSDGVAFLERYAGGWQELFPNAGDPTTVEGRDYPFHGEAATARWTVEESSRGLLAEFTSPNTGLVLTRTMGFGAAPGTLVLDETVTNPTAYVRHFTWGHHLVLGAPFLEAGCHLDLPVTWGWIPTLPGDVHRLEPTDRFVWPNAADREGQPIDLRDVPGPEIDTHDGLYMTGLDAGYLAAENPRLNLRFEITFDIDVFRWVTLWMPYGGLHDGPLAGMYGLGIEPWRTPLALADAIEAGESLRLAPGGNLHTQLEVHIGPIVAGSQ